MEYYVYDSDLIQEKLDQLISEKPELAILKHIGEIDVDLEGDIEENSNEFSAPYQEGWVKGGGTFEEVKNLKVFWIPTEDDIDSLQDLVDSKDLDSKIFKLFKSKVLSISNKNVFYDITSAITSDKLDKLRKEYLKENGSEN